MRRPARSEPEEDKTYLRERDKNHHEKAPGKWNSQLIGSPLSKMQVGQHLSPASRMLAALVATWALGRHRGPPLPRAAPRGHHPAVRERAEHHGGRQHHRTPESAHATPVYAPEGGGAGAKAWVNRASVRVQRLGIFTAVATHVARRYRVATGPPPTIANGG